MSDKFNKEFLDSIKIEWKSQKEVADELRKELKEFEAGIKKKK
jgi:hypothetical protein